MKNKPYRIYAPGMLATVEAEKGKFRAKFESASGKTWSMQFNAIGNATALEFMQDFMKPGEENYILTNGVGIQKKIDAIRTIGSCLGMIDRASDGLEDLSIGQLRALEDGLREIVRNGIKNDHDALREIASVFEQVGLDRDLIPVRWRRDQNAQDFLQEVWHPLGEALDALDRSPDGMPDPASEDCPDSNIGRTFTIPGPVSDRQFLVRLLEEGEPYGRSGIGRASADLIEFYDTRFCGEFDADLYPLGMFVGHWSLSTLVQATLDGKNLFEVNGPVGLSLQSGSPDWSIDKRGASALRLGLMALGRDVIQMKKDYESGTPEPC